MVDPLVYEDLKGLILDKAVSRGKFTLASGQKSSYYIDSKKFLLNGRGVDLVGRAVRQSLGGLGFDAIGGLEVGAIPIAAAVVAQMYIGSATVTEGFFVRKALKDHGSQRLVEGNLKPDARAVVVEDVTTTGESVLKAARAVEAAGGRVVRVLTLIDRQQGAGGLLAALGYDFRCIFTARDLGLQES